jgi:alpha-glucosidase (family GH31 glycosyl hydrolase)
VTAGPPGRWTDVPALARIGLALVVALSFLTASAAWTTASATVPDRTVLRLSDGTRLVAEREPFRLVVLDRRGREQVGTVAGVEGPPVRLPGLDGPMPVEPLGSAGGFPAVGFVVGADPAVSWPLPVFTGNRMFGAETGVVVSLVEVTRVVRRAEGLDLLVRTDAPALAPARVTVRRLPGGGAEVDVRPPAGLDPVSTVTSLRTPRKEALYGLGARKDRFDQRGLLRSVWVEQQNASDERTEAVTCPSLGCDYTAINGAQAAYLVQPSVHGSRGWTAWFGGTALSRVDLAASDPRTLRWGVAAPRMRMHLAGGGLVDSAIAHATDVGRAPAPPRWVHEPWVDVINEGEGEAAPNGGGFTGGARVRADVLEVVRRSRELGLPLGVVGVEGWQTVPRARRLFGRLRDRGLHLSAYWNPFHSPGNPGYDAAARRDLFIEDPAGNPYPFVNNRGAVTYGIDWTKPGATRFWKQQLRRSLRLGFEGWMHDFGEFVTEGMRFADGTPPEHMHNRYPVLLHRASRAAARAWERRHPRSETFFYVRSGFDGVQRSTGSVFPGDETTDWAQGSGLPSVVPAMLNLALGGFPTFTTDVGGYFDFIAPRTTPELMTRWGQLAALTPVMRVHTSTSHGSLYPHELRGTHLRAWRRYARLKVRLAPLVHRLTVRAAHGEGIGAVRPVVLADRSRAARSVDDQWLLGRDLLVAPVLRKGARSRSVYLPRRARWRPVRVDRSGRLVAAGAPLRGGGRVDVPTSVRDIPLFVRVGGGRGLPLRAVR